MSDDEIVLNVEPKSQIADSASDERPKYKSWRKKFRKMKLRFDAEMRDNTSLFKDEQKLESLARRLRESNDQILDLLLDLNQSLVVPPEIRFNVKYQKEWPDDEHIDIHKANEMLMEAKGLEQEGRYSHAQLVQLKASLQTHLAAADAQPLASLEAESPHLVYNPRDHEFPEAMSEIANNVAFYSYENEEDFLKHLDNKLGEPLPLATNDKDQTGPNYFSNLSAREMDREVELRNPQSVHNWLKKHNISIDGTEEKPDTDTPAASGKKGSRKLAQKIGDRALERARERDDGSPIGSVAGNKPDMDLAEEDTGLDDVPSKRRKSRGDNDDTYRPKGGRSGKVKRKREDGESRGSSKKPKTSMGGMSDA